MLFRWISVLVGSDRSFCFDSANYFEIALWYHVAYTLYCIITQFSNIGSAFNPVCLFFKTIGLILRFITECFLSKI